MGEIAILLKHVSKCFKQYAHPVERLNELLLPGKGRANEFWALRDINLEVPRGQTIGIVGQNGSGKSTLLKIIASTLTPTTGEMKVYGRLSALLELGSGFNPEFTGQQNVFFNGQLLGLNRNKIERKFDEIAAFADIGKFLYQPVKSYSSGMMVRLAFAVATSIEPDILIVDEALAVGDEAFQRKCFSRIQSIQERGGTILFVSHASSSIIELCNSAVLLDRGELLLSGSPKFVISKYRQLIYAPDDKLEDLRQEIRRMNNHSDTNLEKLVLPKWNSIKNSNLNQTKAEAFYDLSLIPKSTISYTSRGAEIEKACITTLDRKIVNVLIRGKEYIYNYSIIFTEAAYKVRFGMLIKTISGLELGGAVSHTPKNPIKYVKKDEVVQIEFKFRCLLQSGVYFLNAGVVGFVNGTEVFLARKIDVAMFRVQLEENILNKGYIDFCIESHISYMKSI